MNTPLSPVSGRLASLDILRGFDLFLLVFFQPVFVALGQRLNFPWLNDILYQFDHESWIVNPEKPDVPLNKNDAFQKVQKRRVQEKR